MKGDQPAFPIPAVEFSDGSLNRQWAGMTLRDYFAAQAITGAIDSVRDRLGEVDPDFVLAIAKTAYNIADAMLHVRELERAP